MDRIEPAEPMDRIEPAEPMDRIDPAEPIDASEPNDSADPTDAADNAEPSERHESTDQAEWDDLTAITFSNPARQCPSFRSSLPALQTGPAPTTHRSAPVPVAHPRPGCFRGCLRPQPCPVVVADQPRQDTERMAAPSPPALASPVEPAPHAGARPPHPLDRRPHPTLIRLHRRHATSRPHHRRSKVRQAALDTAWPSPPWQWLCGHRIQRRERSSAGVVAQPAS